MRKIVVMALTVLTAGIGWVPASALAEQSPWREATSDHFIIDAQLAEPQLRGFAEQIERFDAALRALSGISQEGSVLNKLRIIGLPNTFDVARAQGNSQSGVGGFYIPRAAGSIAVVPMKTNSYLRDSAVTPTLIILHEYAHHFFFRNFMGAYPRWFIEGYAEAVSAARFEPDGAVSIGLDEPARRSTLAQADNGSIMGLFEPAPKPGVALSISNEIVFYARAWQLTHFMLFDPRRQEQFRSYLTLLGNGTPSDEAARAAFGDLVRLQAEARSHYADGRIAALRIAPDHIHVGAIGIRPLSSGETAMMPTVTRSLIGVSYTTAQAVFKEASRAAAPFPSDPHVQEALAEAALDAGALDVSDAAAARAIKADPKATEALLDLAKAARKRAADAKDAGAWPQIRRWLVAANRSNPDAAEPLFLYYRSYLAEGVAPVPAAVRGLERAAVIAPESAGIRMTLAAHYLGEKRTADARALLSPIAYAPHGSTYQPLALLVLNKLDTESPVALAKQLAAAANPPSWNSGD